MKEFSLIENLNEIKLAEKIFDSKISLDKNKGLLIPVKNLDQTIFLHSALKDGMFEESKETLDVILQARKIVFNTDFKYETKFLSKLFSYLPIRIEYNLIRSSVDCDTYPVLYESFKELEWNDKRMTKINFIRLVQIKNLVYK